MSQGIGARVVGILVLALAAMHGPARGTTLRSATLTDSFASAPDLTSSGLNQWDATGDNTAATKEAGEPTHAAHGGGFSVWGKWTAPNSGWVTIDTAGSLSTVFPPFALDTVVGVYTGSAVNALTEITSGDDEASQTTTPFLLTTVATFEAVQGTTYYIAVDGYSFAATTDVGTITLKLTLQPIAISFGGVGAAFDSTAASWTLDPAVNGSQWAFDATPSTFPSGIAHSGSVSLNFNNGVDYAGVTFGRATSPSITTFGLTNPVVDFWCNYHTETRTTQFDQRFLRILDGNTNALLKECKMASMGYTFALGANPDDGGAGPCSEAYIDLETGKPASGWHKHRLFLQPAWTTIKIQFFFNSVDDLRNNYSGWAIDDLAVQSHPTPAPTGWPNVYADPGQWNGIGNSLETVGNEIRFSWISNNVGSPGVHMLVGCHPQSILDRSFLFYDASHGHFHLSQYTEYALWRDTGAGALKKVARGKKRSFCLEDTRPTPTFSTNSYSPGCNASYQAISYGWQDVYDRGLIGQSIDITGLTRGVPYVLIGVEDPLNRLRETDDTNNADAVQFTLPPGDLDPIPTTHTNANPFPQTTAGLTVTSATVGTSPTGSFAVHVVGTGFDSAMTMLLYGSNAPEVVEAPMYALTNPGGGAPYVNGAADMWVDIPAGFPIPVAIDVLRATGQGVCFRISGTPSVVGLVVDPAASADFTGAAPTGPFTSTNAVLTLSNASVVPINWTAAHKEWWLGLSASSGSIPSYSSVTVTLTASTTAGNALTPGSYADLITFANTSNGGGSTTRAVNLFVTGAATSMVVNPSLGYWATRQGAGAVTPTNEIYTVLNQGALPLNWTATPSQAWITATPATGFLNPGTFTNITVALGGGAPTTAGSYFEKIVFTSTASTPDTTTRAVSLLVTTSTPPLTITTPSASPTSTGQSPYPAAGTAAGAVSVSWTNLTTGDAGNGTFTGANWTAPVVLVAGPNVVRITIFDPFGASTSQEFTISYAPKRGGGGGGGGGGGCGATGLEAALLLGLLGVLRRPRRG